MKTLISIILLTLSFSVSAGPYHHNHYYHNHGHWRYSHNHWEWLVPTIVGGAIVYTVIKSQERPQEVIVVEKQVVENNCSPWVETQNSDGTITRTRTCKK